MMMKLATKMDEGVLMFGTLILNLAIPLMFSFNSHTRYLLLMCFAFAACTMLQDLWYTSFATSRPASVRRTSMVVMLVMNCISLYVAVFILPATSLEQIR